MGKTKLVSKNAHVGDKSIKKYKEVIKCQDSGFSLKRQEVAMMETGSMNCCWGGWQSSIS